MADVEVGNVPAFRTPKERTVIRSMCGILALFATLPSAFCAEFISIGDTSIRMAGRLEPGDDFRLTNLLQWHSNHGRVADSLFIDSGGGNVAAGIAVAFVVRKIGLNTILLPRAKCSSACVVVFASGRRKLFYKGASVGVHSAAYRDTRRQADFATETMASMLQQLGVPPSVLAKMFHTPPNSIAYLTDDDFAGWALVVPATAGQEASDFGWR